MIQYPITAGLKQARFYSKLCDLDLLNVRMTDWKICEQAVETGVDPLWAINKATEYGLLED